MTRSSYTEALISGQQTADQVAQQLCGDSKLSTKAGISAETTVQVATLVLEALVKQSAVATSGCYTAPLLKQQQHKDAVIAYTHQHTRSAAISHVVEAALAQKLLTDENPLINLFNWDTFKSRLANLCRAFPEPEFNHAVAVKANPIRGILRGALAQNFGAECASIAEAKHALSLGFEPRKIVYDSPCKTLNELREMVLAGVYINLDNEEEICKVNEILAKLGNSEETMKTCAAQFGLRINPMVGGGTIDATSTATAVSKFGLPLTETTKPRLLAIYKQNPWLHGVHVHVGSQGCSLDLLAAGVKRAVHFALEINAHVGYKQVCVLDIGGGMPTVYDGGECEAYDFQDYANTLREQVPELFASGFTSIITEFGRSIFVKPGVTVSKVEAIKNWVGQHIAVVHVGADQFPRTAYQPELWSHCISVLDHHGHSKKNLSSEYLCQDIAGPLCFSGDYLAKQLLLPPIHVGDFVVIHDTGGYTMSMFSKYNSRQVSSYFAYSANCQSVKFFMLKDRETTEETLSCWGLDCDVDL
ncbi:hypothetical protein F443_08357 [Plasmopara halstedii]|uniref:Diaminopimelate decarboxylase n=1 Tax=Plasmopara halstedii TaxID=4781 RepID=A0A0N7L453_PLAHL|nr:hypothetical protein F443_08357 [Plasmopara halstedii]CEG37715.1 hypothetical protein F443_08357 [Plasmopara halstedii]|eukprot:XP_024574084.1 hypothetical protein F443_08357 [Plasmopara halstedii]